ncbi:hypothetical protein [Latilactobacillus graminis]|nr:hypothetical protein [Latilactobacillus graminis]
MQQTAEVGAAMFMSDQATKRTTTSVNLDPISFIVIGYRIF